MRKVVLAIALLFTSMAPVQASDQPLTVMSRNLYLGADVGVALELIPDFSAAAQIMWDEVAATDFKKRAPLLAEEAISNGADVIGLQEATHWYCKENFWSNNVVIYDFIDEFLKATKAQGSEYVLASRDRVTALNIGYSIPAIPYLTMVKDPEIFQPIFGSDSAACGFEIGDAIAIKKELSGKVLRVGNTEYETSYSIVPRVMTIYRGYTWIDLEFYGKKIRIVSTHLESLWDTNKVPNATLQAQQLIKDLQKTRMPLVVIGDFNSDPRDPRPNPKSNPGGQPEASEVCKAQVSSPAIENAIDTCSSYWTMRRAGYTDSGPDALNPVNYSWGLNALLTGPDPDRKKVAIAMGNKNGFTDRLDYIFLRNGASVIDSKIIGNKAPEEEIWASDHAGLVVRVELPENSKLSPALDPHKPFPISFWNWVGIGFVALLSTVVYYRRKKNHG